MIICFYNSFSFLIEKFNRSWAWRRFDLNFESINSSVISSSNVSLQTSPIVWWMFPNLDLNAIFHSVPNYVILAQTTSFASSSIRILTISSFLLCKFDNRSLTFWKYYQTSWSVNAELFGYLLLKKEINVSYDD